MSNSADGFVSQAAYGRHRGVSRKTVTDWKQKGILVLDADGLVDVVRTDTALNDRPANYRGGVTSAAPKYPKGNKSSSATDRVTRTVTRFDEDDEADEDGLSFADLSDAGIADASNWKLAEATRIKEIYLALKRRQEYLLSQGKLVVIEEVASQLENEYAVVRERLLGIPGKISASLVGLDRAAIDARILDEITEALRELHDPGKLQAGGSGAVDTPEPGEAGA